MSRYTLHNGDALAWLQSLPTGSADIIITDPPYSSGGQFRADRSGRSTSDKYVQTGQAREYPEFEGDSRDQRSFVAWCACWMWECRRVVKEHGLLLTFIDWRQLPAMTDAVQAGGWLWRGIVPWNKNGGRPLPQGFRPQCEYVVWSSKGPLQVNHAEGLIPGFLTVSVERGEEKVHPTQKPLALMMELCRAAPVGGIVLDPFMGSGSTGVAALRTGRTFIGAEASAEYFQIAAERLAAEGDGLTRSASLAGQTSLLGAAWPHPIAPAYVDPDEVT